MIATPIPGRKTSRHAGLVQADRHPFPCGAGGHCHNFWRVTGGERAGAACNSSHLSGVRHLMPDFERRGPQASIVRRRQAMPAWMEMAIDECMGGQKSLGLAGGFEALHLPLSPSGWPMWILRPIIEVAALPVLDIGQTSRPAGVAPSRPHPRPSCESGTVASTLTNFWRQRRPSGIGSSGNRDGQPV